MLDLIPWLDETYIVEMGRLFLCGGDGDTTLLGRGATPLLPICYVGPCLQEISFRLFGVVGARICPFVGLMAASAAFWLRLREEKSLPRITGVLLSLLVLSSPLLFQSALLARVDCWAVAFSLFALACLGDGSSGRGNARLASGAFFAVLSLFVWPTAAILVPMYPAMCFSASRAGLRELARFVLYAIVAVAVLSMPLLAVGGVPLESFARHYSEVTSSPSSLWDVVLPFAREIARSPFIAALSCVGFVAWVRNRRFAAVASFALALAACAKSGLYTFRIAYLAPFFFMQALDAVRGWEVRCPRLVQAFLVAAAAYGFLTGPIGHFALDYPVLPNGLKEALAKEVGVGPVRVFSPDHATYYVGRELGWRQLGFARPSDAEDETLLRGVLTNCEAVVLRDFDPYVPFQQSCTPYGLFCRYVLSRAKAESALPEGKKSWAGRFGSRFSFSWHGPLRLDGFDEVARHEMIRVFRRSRRGEAGERIVTDDGSGSGE